MTEICNYDCPLLISGLICVVFIVLMWTMYGIINEVKQLHFLFGKPVCVFLYCTILHDTCIDYVYLSLFSIWQAVLAAIILVALKGMFKQFLELKRLWSISYYDFVSINCSSVKSKFYWTKRARMEYMASGRFGMACKREPCNGCAWFRFRLCAHEKRAYNSWNRNTITIMDYRRWGGKY